MLKTAVLGFKACYFIIFQAVRNIVREMVSRYTLKNVCIIQVQINDLEYTRKVCFKKMKNKIGSEKHLLEAYLPCSILLH